MQGVIYKYVEDIVNFLNNARNPYKIESNKGKGVIVPGRSTDGAIICCTNEKCMYRTNSAG